MKIEILYFEGCPTYLEAERSLRKVLALMGIEAGIKLVAVVADGEA